MPSTTPDYLQPGLPVLSFLYALFTDRDFSTREHKTWLAAWHSGGDYRGFLDNYRPFPADIETLVAKGVPDNGPDSKEFFRPTPKQARKGVDVILNEIQSLPSKPRTTQDGRSLAQLGADRPVLRTLGVLYLNLPDDPVADVVGNIDGLGVSADLKALLGRLAKQRPAKFASDAEKNLLAVALVDEFIAAPPQW